MRWVDSHKNILQSRILHREKVMERLGKKDTSDWDSFDKKLHAQEIRHLDHYNKWDRKTIKKIDDNN